MNNRPLRILHLSDLHERALFDGMPDRRRRQVEADLRERGMVLGEKFLEEIRSIASAGIDLICITGDIADFGCAEEYKQANIRIRAISSACNVPDSQIIVVPGNHDIERHVHKDTWEAVRQWINKGGDLRSLGKWIAGHADAPSGLAEDLRNKLLERSKAFWDWHNQLTEPTNHKPTDTLGFRRTFQSGTFPGIDIPVHVIGLDSAWLCGDDFDQGRLAVTREQLLALTRNGEVGLDGFRVALIHHPLDHLKDHASTTGLLSENVDLVLHGHQHFAAATDHVSPGSNLRVLAAGCLMEGHIGANWPNEFHLIEVDLQNLDYAVHFRKWARDASVQYWSRASDIYQDASSPFKVGCDVIFTAHPPQFHRASSSSRHAASS